MADSRLASAKVNLFLHVDAPSPDGFHPICSAMVFADIGDQVSLTEGPGLSVSGPFASELSGGGENLVARAVKAFEPFLPGAIGLHLDKRLPVAAGLGGGSSDAGAALRLMRDTFAPQVSESDLESLAASLGSDGAACLWARAVLARGRGEQLSPWPSMPQLFGVLINPGVSVSTAAVYRRFDELGKFEGLEVPNLPPRFQSVAQLAQWLKWTRNDLQPPALTIAPVIGTVLVELEASPGVRLARMSGSGATCFALCEDQDSAQRLAQSLAERHGDWWVQACAFS